MHPSARHAVKHNEAVLGELAGTLRAADIVGWFETQLPEKVLLVLFIPGIVNLADAAGTRTKTVVRGLAAAGRFLTVSTGPRDTHCARSSPTPVSAKNAKKTAAHY